MAWHELPLMFFTLFAQATVGAFMVMAFVIWNGRLSDEEKGRIMRAMFALWVLLGAGFALSTGHLGSPLRALNSLGRVGSSWLSNEIFFGALFFASGGLYWLLETLNKGSEGIRRALMVAAVVLGIVFMYAMIRVYMIETVPTWNNAYTAIGFTVSVILCGALTGQLLLTFAGYDNAKYYRALSLLGGVVVLVSAIAASNQIDQLNGINTAIASARDLIPNIGMLKSMYIAILAVVLAIWLVPQLSGRTATLPMVVIGVVLVFLAEFLNRAIFYNLHMSVGL